MYSKPKKSLGQNFLTDKNLQRKIIAACEFKPSDTVLEVGAGRGELTKLIAPLVKTLYALEIDHNLCLILKESLQGYSNIKLINQDILTLNLKRRFGRLKNKIKVVGNIPYYITTPIIQHLLKYPGIIDTVFITVQKEFGRRMTAPAGTKDYGSFTCFLQYYAGAKIIFPVKKNCFYPVPKVDSVFLRLNIRQNPAVHAKNPALLFKIIRAAFNKRRKTLRNSLIDALPKQKLEAFFSKYGILNNTRPEKLSLQDFANLANI